MCVSINKTFINFLLWHFCLWIQTWVYIMHSSIMQSSYLLLTLAMPPQTKNSLPHIHMFYFFLCYDLLGVLIDLEVSFEPVGLTCGYTRKDNEGISSITMRIQQFIWKWYSLMCPSLVHNWLMTTLGLCRNITSNCSC